VLEHLADDELWQGLSATKEALTPGGRLIVSVPNASCLTALMTRYGDLTHRRLFTEGSMGQLLQAVGFRDIEMFPNEKELFVPSGPGGSDGCGSDGTSSSAGCWRSSTGI
jgi:hypothetical protein